MPNLYLSRGLPGSGKSTAARRFIEDNPGIVRVNRDDLRFMLYGIYWGPPIDEEIITFVQDSLVRAALADGRDVYCDDMNLSEIAVSHRMADARSTPGVHVVWHDFTDVPLSVCQERDARRERHVGADVIRSLYDRYIK
jgi:tRNA uridine 5-carbamoylmethylation protein Kti12